MMKNYLLLLCLTLIATMGCGEEEPINPGTNPPPPPVNEHDTFVQVPDDFSTIQEALNQAESGDTILVNPGTYNENIDFIGKNVLLTSKFYLENDISFISSTIIEGTGGAVVKFMKYEQQTAIIQGFTITGGTGDVYTRPNGNVTLGGGGILGLESSPTIRYNIIENNEATDISGPNSFAGGGGIRLELGSPVVANNIIRNNTGGFGGGVFLDATAAVFKNNLVVGNEAIKDQFGGGGGLYLDFAKPDGNGNRIINNTIVENLTAGEGGGLVLAGNTVYNSLVFVNNIIFNNENDEVFTRLEAEPEDFHPDHCLIEGGYASGTEILDMDPMLSDDSKYLLSGDSPCIDGGIPSADYNDKSEGGNAVAPSMGTSRNDIGMYGGPGAAMILQ